MVVEVLIHPWISTLIHIRVSVWLNCSDLELIEINRRRWIEALKRKVNQPALKLLLRRTRRLVLLPCSSSKLCSAMTSFIFVRCNQIQPLLCCMSCMLQVLLNHPSWCCIVFMRCCNNTTAAWEPDLIVIVLPPSRCILEWHPCPLWPASWEHED